jgi:preprotein translocase subunit SecA
LHVIGTERHESRRVDNHYVVGLGGRETRVQRASSSAWKTTCCGFWRRSRRGPHEHVPRRRGHAHRIGYAHRSLEGAQKKVETYYYDIRKQVFEYDEVMNNQRRAIYAERRRVLEGQDLKELVITYAVRTMDDIVNAYINPELPPEDGTAGDGG